MKEFNSMRLYLCRQFFWHLIVVIQFGVIVKCQAVVQVVDPMVNFVSKVASNDIKKW